MMLEIVFEDEWIIAINKPHGLLVHPSPIARDAEEFALQLVRNHIGAHVYPFHRLDRKTSGVLLFAKTREIAHAMQSILSLEETVKEYHAIVRGYFPEKLELDHPLMNDKGVTQNALTHFQLMETFELPIAFGQHLTSRYSFITAFPKTGRMHQIRKHLNHLRFPIIGDRPHGCNKQNKLFKEKWDMNTMMLHAKSIQFLHPETKKPITILADYQQEFVRVFDLLKRPELWNAERN